jgi:hypothetical protein
MIYVDHDGPPRAPVEYLAHSRPVNNAVRRLEPTIKKDPLASCSHVCRAPPEDAVLQAPPDRLRRWSGINASQMAVTIPRPMLIGCIDSVLRDVGHVRTLRVLE